MTSNLVQDFVFGVDPFGIYTSQYGQSAEQAGLSEGQHKAKRLATMAGGLTGGAVVTPSLLVGGARALQAAGSTKGDFKKRLGAAAAGFVKGIKEPVQAATDISRVQLALRRAKKGKIKLTDAERQSLKRLSSEVRVGDALGALMNPLGSARSARALRSGILTPGAAKNLSTPLNKASLMVGMPLAGGGAIGSVGAGIQYTKGRETERKFQQRARQPMYKMSSAERAVIQAAYFVELDKIAKSKSLAESLGRVVRRVRDRTKKVTGLPKKMYGDYARGYHDKSVSQSLGDLGKDLKNLDFGRLAVPALVGVGGAAAGVGLGSALSNR
jgi:hypothetical protein